MNDTTLIVSSPTCGSIPLLQDPLPPTKDRVLANPPLGLHHRVNAGALIVAAGGPEEEIVIERCGCPETALAAALRCVEAGRFPVSIRPERRSEPRRG